MFASIRKHLTYANTAATLALMFALTGGAVAATSHSGGGGSPSHAGLTATVAKSKAKGKSGPRGPAGPRGATGVTGPTGPAGPAGPGGAKGETGAAGTGTPGAEGKEGKVGESVTIGKAGGECLEGGTKFSNASGSGAACNGEPGQKGEPGSPWTPNSQLPSGATETGVWAAHFPSESEGGKGPEANTSSTISFPIQLEAAIGTWYYVTAKEQTEQKGTEYEACKGSVVAPAAPRGTFCLYEGDHAGEAEPTIPYVTPPTSLGSTVGAGKAGAVVHVHYEGGLREAPEIEGSWAVTAP